MSICILDIETRSRADLKKEGAYRYAADASTDLLVVCYAFDDGPVKIWLPRLRFDLPQQIIDALNGTNFIVQPECPPELLEHIANGGEIRAHNAVFERQVLNGPAGQRVGFPFINISQMVCTMAKMQAHGIPSSLEAAAEALGATPKDVAGANDMRYLCKPRKDGTFAEPEDEPQRWINLIRYCVTDVVAERDIDRLVPDLSESEQRVWELDQKINDRGWKVDLPTVENIQTLVDEYKAELYAKCKAWTGLSPSQTGALADWCRDNGYLGLADLQADTVRHAVADPKCPVEVRRVLTLYSTYNMKAVSKYEAMARAAGEDGRLRGMFIYFGAHTGRFSSKIVQLQNLYRPAIDDAEAAVELIANGGSLADLRFMWDGIDPMKIMASCVRSVLVADEKRDLLFLDFAGVEARCNAWLFDEAWKLDAYRAFDRGEGPDLYNVAYARAFNMPVEDVTPKQRKVGKVMELALGYGGGAGAFSSMAPIYQVDLNELADSAWPTLPPDVKEEASGAWDWAVEQKRTLDLPQKVFVVCDALKRLWRRAHPKIVQGWYDLEQAAIAAVMSPGQPFAIPNKRIHFRVMGQWLYMRLPSGRKLAYYKPQYDGEALRFMGVDTYTRRWCRTATFSGKLDENADSGICRDLLVNAMFNLEEAGYPLIGSIHDEIVAEPTEGFGSYDEAAQLMCALPEWAAGFPVAVEGHRQKRYRK